jgi:hypothetical protein
MNDVNTRPETPTLDNTEEKSEVASNIAQRLGDAGEANTEEKSDAPKAKQSNMIDLNNLSIEQIQDLQEKFTQTPRRVKKKEEYHTIELRQIDGKVIVEWGESYFDLKHDPAQRRDVMKTMIPVRFHGSDDFVDILWSEQFMLADKVTCRVLKMDKEEEAEVVGTTIKRGKDGEETSQEVEMYVNKVIITLTVQLPNGEEITMDGKFAN